MQGLTTNHLIVWGALTVYGIVAYKVSKRHHNMPVDERPTLADSWRGFWDELDGLFR